jgi:DNA-binding transcriptional ArsR family regulator
MGPTGDEVLDLEARRRILAYVRANPGLHLRGLAEKLSIPVSTLEYHCYQLTRHGHLATRESAGFKAFYPGEGMDRRDKDILYLVRHDAPRRICTHLLLHPGATPGDLKAVVGVSAPTLSFHLKKMRDAGLMREEPDGRTKRLYVTDPERVANLLVTYKGSFLDDAVDRFSALWLDLHPPGPKEPAPEAGVPASAPATPSDAGVGAGKAASSPMPTKSVAPVEKQAPPAAEIATRRPMPKVLPRPAADESGTSESEIDADGDVDPERVSNG